MPIQLKGYEDAFKGTANEGSVFFKDSEAKANDGEDNDVLLKDIISFTTNKVPTKKEVAEYLQKKAIDVQGLSRLIVPNNVTAEKSDLESAIIQLLDEFIEDIAKGSDLEYLKEHMPTPIPDEDAQRRYLQVTYGILPYSLIQLQKEKGKIIDFNWYENVMSNGRICEAGIGIIWQMLVKLPGDALPDKAEMDILWKNEAYRSKPLNILTARRFNAEYAKGIFDAIYEILTPEQIAKLPDDSVSVRESMALQTIAKIHEHLQQIEGGIKMQQAFASLFGGGGARPDFVSLIGGGKARSGQDS